ncbi:MAG: hypothetical protein GXP56_09475 [Deltaproteobacteria bacterium]|nr:hypothetical protein [Deltaproteobacteria bacterium]
MKKKINLLIFSLMIINFSFCRPAAASDIVDRVVAIVNDDIVTLVQLNKETMPYRNDIESSGYPAGKKKQMLKQISKKVLDVLIDRSLTQQEAKRYHITVSDTEINNALENIRKAKSLNREEFKNALKEEGLTLAEYRENIKKQILQSRLINYSVKSKVIITDIDIKKQYKADFKKYSGRKKYHLRNILMDNEDEIKEIKKKLDRKKKFITLAKKYSMSPNASDGGDLGMFDINNFSASIKNSISKLKKGDYTNVISTPNGFQIFYVEDIVLEGKKTYEQAYNEIHEKLYRKKVKKKFEAWLKALKKKASIKIMF